jgi:S-adenosylmethionine-diacylglycerol 3-amino-3-carboxypropyl transferase
MQSEFYNVSLDRIRYSLVWESSDTLYNALDIQAHDQLLVITSAGCNVLNALLKNPQKVTAIDLNGVQNRLLLFKKQLILSQKWTTFRDLLGLRGTQAVAAAWQQVQPALSEEERTYWTPFFAQHPEGLMAAGKLEAYLTGFLPTLPPAQQQSLGQLLQFEAVEAQWQFFLQELDASDFKARFIDYFDEQNLSKGRAPQLFRYVSESGGASFYQRLRQQLASVLVKDNFFFRFFFFGPEGLPEALLPPCYRQEHYAALQACLAKLEVVQGEAIDYLLSPAGRSITKASLSNIFEYTSPEEFQRVCRALFGQSHRPLRVVYWNLLQDQGEPADAPAGACPRQGPWLQASLSEALSQQEACFYFRNVRVLQTVAAAVSVYS